MCDFILKGRHTQSHIQLARPREEKRRDDKLQFLLLSATGITAFRKSFCSLRYQSRTWLCISHKNLLKKKKVYSVHYNTASSFFSIQNDKNSKERKIVIVHHTEVYKSIYNRIIIGVESLIKVVQSKVSQ
jgi:hypothetical protein